MKYIYYLGGNRGLFSHAYPGSHCDTMVPVRKSRGKKDRLISPTKGEGGLNVLGRSISLSRKGRLTTHDSRRGGERFPSLEVPSVVGLFSTSITWKGRE